MPNFNYYHFEGIVHSTKVKQDKLIDICDSIANRNLPEINRVHVQAYFLKIIQQGMIDHLDIHENILQAMCHNSLRNCTQVVINILKVITRSNTLGLYEMDSLTSNICKKFVNLDLNKIQLCELSLLHQIMKESDDTSYRTMIIYEFLHNLIQMKLKIHSKNVPLNSNACDFRDFRSENETHLF